MAEYIEREAVMQKFADHVKRSNNSDFVPAPTWNQAVQIVEDCPAADVQPVVHGHWMEQKIFTEDSGFKNPIVCSCCGSICVADLYGELFLANYCPSCGARMDEDG